jgi:predicted nucleotidyltransferase
MSVYLQSIRALLQELKPILRTKYHVRSIGLFGSVVRDDFADGSSDVDIIVDFDRPIGIEFVDMADMIERLLNRKVDVVSRAGIKAPYFAVIEPEIVYV